MASIIQPSYSGAVLVLVLHHDQLSQRFQIMRLKRGQRLGFEVLYLRACLLFHAYRRGIYYRLFIFQIADFCVISL